MVAPSGEQYEISGGGYRAVVTECGAGLRVLEHDGRPLIDGYGEDEPASGGRGQLLVPWPNRIRDGHYRYEGRDLQLPLNETARSNAAHGLTRWASWTVEEQTAHSVSLVYRLMAQPGYPWTLDLQVVYDLSADGLTVTLTATNLSSSDAPYAHGAHPYLTVGESGVEGWELTLPAATRVLVDDRKIPVDSMSVEGTDYDFRLSRPVRQLRLDDPFTDLAPGPDGNTEVVLTQPGEGSQVTLWMDASYRWVQVYTGDDLPEARARRSIAVEPMTSPPNAFNSGDGLVVLGAAGSGAETLSASWGLRSS